MKTDLAHRIYDRMKALNCRFKAINIVYLEDSDEFGNPLPETHNSFNDRSLLLQISNDRPEIIFNELATTEPGWHYTSKPMNKSGAFNIELDVQHQDCWQFGHHGYGRYAHFSLIQCAPVSGYRDGNKDSLRVGDRKHSGSFGINQHGIYGYTQPINDIGKASAGCLVRWDYGSHEDFMNFLRVWHAPDAKFDTIVLDTTKLTPTLSRLAKTGEDAAGG